MAVDVASIIARYRGELPGGAEGDQAMLERLSTDVLLTAEGEDVQRRHLSTAEIDDLLAYLGWQTWDMLAARSTEGESGLIPRQEYESIAFVQAWADYPRFIDEITREVGVDGVIEFGPILQLLLLRRCRELAPEVLERRLECDNRLIDVGLGAHDLRVSRRLEVDQHPFDVLPGGFQAIDCGDFCLGSLWLGLGLELVDADVRRTNLRGDLVLVGLECGRGSRLRVWRLHVLLLRHISGA